MLQCIERKIKFNLKKKQKSNRKNTYNGTIDLSSYKKIKKMTKLDLQTSKISKNVKIEIKIRGSMKFTFVI